MDVEQYLDKITSGENGERYVESIVEPYRAFLKTIPLPYREMDSFKAVVLYLVSKFTFFNIKENQQKFDKRLDFLFDQKSGYMTFNLGGQHAHLITFIYLLRNPKKLVDNGKTFLSHVERVKELRHAGDAYTEVPDGMRLGEKYLEEGQGFFMSSMYSERENLVITLSRDFKFKLPFPKQNYKFDYID